ncbi:xanthine dehydrogenase small subunit [Microcoleus sp. FACHB-1515]|uniref:xanthine dehydrogenase small subunit n=1 Tax=Cyanophyceae TaxID=3028117 RepID=UPI001687416A|nr:xanthine dehydrogenase small subunit [Microcoleus sp. FACHB-1515]MBD2092069.1 xanthine dehydrogenase small subunit [Microcoleus sp. FACHB-1515]
MTETATQLTFTLNGESIAPQHSPNTTLLQYLLQTGRTGTKQGCGDGDCGACTVAIVSKDANGQPSYQAVNSCLIPLGAVAGRSIVTVEGIAGESLHPVQAAMIETGGSQCGYCTPGFIMSLFAAYYDGVVDDASVEGNLCRCTGYLSIRKAAAQVTQAQPNDEFVRQLQSIDCTPQPLHYQGVHEFYRPTSLADAIALLQQHPDATLIAGATDLGLEMSHDRRTFSKLISLEAVPELLQIDRTADRVEIGAALPLSHIESQLHGEFPALDAMLHLFAARQIRNRATLGGNIGTASPIGDLPPVLLALDAELQIAGQSGERSLPIAEFFRGYRQTALQPGEIIVSVKIPRSQSARRLSRSYKVGKRGTDDISTVAAAFTIDLDANDRIVHARLAYGGVAATPIRAIAIEEQLIDRPWTPETIQQIKPLLRETFAPLTDLRGSASYRKLLVANLFEKFFIEATS